eukprot:tig00000217_g19138.t1
MPIVEIPKRAVLVEGENGQIIEMQKGIPDVVKILEDPITRVQVPETTALDAYYKDATFWSIHSKQAPKIAPVCYRCLRLMYEIPSIPRKKGTAEAVAEATEEGGAYADYAKKVDKANEWRRRKGQKTSTPDQRQEARAAAPVYPKNSWLCMQCYRFLDDRGLLAIWACSGARGRHHAVSAQAQNQMAQTVLGGRDEGLEIRQGYGRRLRQSTIAPGSGQEKIRKQDIAAPDMSRIDEILRKSTEVITEINETGRSVFILNKKNADGSTRYDIRQARQSRYWVLFNTHKRLGAAREFEVEAFRGSLAQVLSDAEFYKFIRFNLKEEDGKYKDDTFANAIIGIRVQGAWNCSKRRADAERILQNAELIDDLNRGRIGMGKDPPTILAELIPEENYGGRLQEYLTKTLPETQRRDLLKQWSHARNQNNTDNNTDGYLFSIFQTESAPSDDPRFAPQAAEIGGLGRGAERARGAEGAGAAVN